MNTHVQSVVEALECFKTNQHKCLLCEYNPHADIKWPYGCTAGQINIIDDAIALLKAQEVDITALTVKCSDLLNEKLKAQATCLISRKELAAWEDALWLEIRAWPQPILMPDAITGIDIKNKVNEEGRFIFTSGHIQMLKLYGTQWRCWTKRPTKEEMKATLWLTIL